MFRIDDFAVIALAVFALTVLIKDTAGPFEIFLKVREFLEGSVEHPRMFFMDLFACPWCVSTWVSLIANLIYVLVGRYSIITFFAYWFGAIGVSGLLYSYIYSHVDD